MKTRAIRIVIILALCLAVTAALAPPFAGSAMADTPQTLTATFVMTIMNFPNSRSFSLSAGDEVLQFRRDNVTLSSPQTGVFHTLVTHSGSVSGDISGTSTWEANAVEVPVGVRSGFNSFGFTVGTATFTSTSPSGSFDALYLADFDTQNLPYPPYSYSEIRGYLVSRNESGCFAGQKLIGTMQGATSDEDANPGIDTIRGVVNFRRYSASAITRMADSTFTGTATMGLQRAIPTLTGDTLIRFSGSPHYQTTVDNWTDFGDASGGASVSVTSGFLSGATIANWSNSVIHTASGMGWGAARATFTKGASQLTGVMITDTVPGSANWPGWWFATLDGNTGEFANKEYYGTYIQDVSGIPTISGTVVTDELSQGSPGAVTETTTSGDYTVDATAEADTAVVKTGTGTPTITVAEYSSNPGNSFQGDIGKYVDVFMPDPTDVDEVEIRVYYTDAEIAGIAESSLRMYWVNESTGEWQVCSDTGVNTAATNGYSGYIWAKLRVSGTSPTLSYLSGQGFGGGGSGGGATSAPVSPNIYIGMAGAFAAAILAYFARRKLIFQE